jgi:hypothetical protein
MVYWLNLRTSKLVQARKIEVHTSFTSSSALNDMTNIIVPMMICMGIIQDLRRPIDGKNFESTIGDHRSLREYG